MDCAICGYHIVHEMNGRYRHGMRHMDKFHSATPEADVISEQSSSVADDTIKALNLSNDEDDNFTLNPPSIEMPSEPTPDNIPDFGGGGGFDGSGGGSDW